MSDFSELKEERIRDLLSTLNEWEQLYGTTYSSKPNLKSLGESNARIADLKEKLKAEGACFHWNGADYILDAIVQPGQGSQGPDERVKDP